MKSLSVLKAIVKHLFGVLLALALSATLAALIILYTPLLFNLAFREISELAADYKDVDMSLYDEQAFRSYLQVPGSERSDKALFRWLQANSQNSHQINNFFSRGLKVRNPESCQYTIYGKHRTLNYFWIIEGEHCKPVGSPHVTTQSEVNH